MKERASLACWAIDSKREEASTVPKELNEKRLDIEDCRWDCSRGVRDGGEYPSRSGRMGGDRVQM
jgi:hypothetical protein